MNLQTVECPWCGHQLVGYSQMTGKAGMADGDISVCWGCKNLSIIEITLTMRKPTEEETAQLQEHPSYEALMAGLLIEDDIDHAVHAIQAQVRQGPPRQEPPT